MEDLRFEVEPNIQRASTPPASLYTDERWFEAVQQRVLSRAWHWIGDAELLPPSFHAAPTTLLPGSLQEPLLLTRGEDGRLAAFSNVCTHRGAILCEAPSSSRGLRCPYHGRKFRLDGTCVGSPEFETLADFPSSRDHLRSVPLGVWTGQLFAGISPREPFGAWMGSVLERFAWLPLDRARPIAERSRDFEVRANWALYCENYLEGLHVPFVHPGLAQAIEYASYSTELWPFGSLQIARAQPGEDAFEPPPGVPEAGQRIAGYYVFLFPTTMLNLYPWGISLNAVQPLGVDRTRILFRSYAWDAARLDAGASRDLDSVELEDERVVESVQVGMRSRLRAPGRYSPTRETGVHHFHRLLQASLTA